MGKHNMPEFSPATKATAKRRAFILAEHRKKCGRGICRCGLKEYGLPKFNGQK